MALRIITQKSLKYFTDLKDYLAKFTADSEAFQEVDEYENSNFLSNEKSEIFKIIPTDSQMKTTEKSMD